MSYFLFVLKDFQVCLIYISLKMNCRKQVDFRLLNGAAESMNKTKRKAIWLCNNACIVLAAIIVVQTFQKPLTGETGLKLLSRIGKWHMICLYWKLQIHSTYVHSLLSESCCLIMVKLETASSADVWVQISCCILHLLGTWLTIKCATRSVTEPLNRAVCVSKGPSIAQVLYLMLDLKKNGLIDTLQAWVLEAVWKTRTIKWYLSHFSQSVNAVAVYSCNYVYETGFHL